LASGWELDAAGHDEGWRAAVEAHNRKGRVRFLGSGAIGDAKSAASAATAGPQKAAHRVLKRSRPPC